MLLYCLGGLKITARFTEPGLRFQPHIRRAVSQAFDSRSLRHQQRSKTLPHGLLQARSLRQYSCRRELAQQANYKGRLMVCADVCCLCVVFKLNRPFHPASSSMHPVSVLIHYPRQIQAGPTIKRTSIIKPYRENHCDLNRILQNCEVRQLRVRLIN